MRLLRSPAASVLVPLLLAIASLTGCSSSSETTPPPERRVAVLFTTDEHSHVFAVAPEVDDWPTATTAGTGALVGGVARRARIIEQQRAAMAETVVLSTGDATQGTLANVPFAVASFDLQLMKAMGYDAVALGNHEFDQTPRGLALSVSAATGAGSVGAPPLVLTNVKFSATSAADDGLAALYGAGKAIAPSHLITTAGGTRVGVVAAMGLSAATDCAPAAAPLTFTDGLATSSTNALAAIAAQLQPAIDALRQADKADVVVLLDHGGYVPGATSQEDELLAARLTGVDLVLSGHTHADATPVRWVTDPAGHRTALLQTSPYGDKLGRAELAWAVGERPHLDEDPARTTFLAVDDRVLPSANPTVTALISGLVGSLEVAATGPSFLEQTLYAVLGTPVTHDPARPGSLYFYPLGSTTFTTRGLGTGESNILNLDTDAMLAAANAFGGTTQVALQARGAMRADLVPGKTGTLSFADVFRVAPLGADPTDGTPGYPVLRFALSPAELRAAMEGTLLLATQDGDFFVSPAGLEVTYDRTRPMFDTADPLGPGWITRLATVAADGTETPLYDVALPPYYGWVVNYLDPATFVKATATYQLAAFASALGIKPRHPDTLAKVEAADLPTLILRRPGGSAVKDHQALASYVASICGGPTGPLPARYDDASTTEGKLPRRMICVGAACP